MARGLFVRFCLIAITFIVYWQTISFGYVDFDDPEYVRDNAYVMHGLTEQGVKWAFTTGFVANWHPLTWLSLMADREIHGENTGGFHLTNVALHAANVVLLLTLLCTMTGAFWRSALVAALLAVHPMHVESVAWISERKDVLSMFFGLLTAWAYVVYTRRGGIGWYGLVVVLFALGLMAKPMLVTLPFVLLLLDFWPLNRFGRNSTFPIENPRWTRILAEKVPLILIAAAAAVVTVIVQHGSGMLEYGIWTPISARVANAAVAYVRYLGKLCWPVHLAALYPNPAILGHQVWSTLQVAGSVVLLLVMSIAACVLSRERRYRLVGWLWFVGTLVPVIGLVQMGPQSMADRYAYLPFIGLYIIISWGLAELAGASRVRVVSVSAVTCTALLALLILAHQQVKYWRDSSTLFEHAIALTNDNWLIYNNLAAMRERQGNFQDAAAQVQAAIAVNGSSAWLHDHLGSIFSQMGPEKLYDAQREFEAAIDIDPTYAKSQGNLAVVLTQRGQLADAIAHFRRVVELNPDDAEAHKALAIALGNIGQREEALREIRKAILLQSNVPEYIHILNVIETQPASQP